jgi:CRP-like cAMP-binding protein
MGEMGIVGRTQRNASVVARSPLRVIVLTEQDFRGISRSFSKVAQRIQEAVEERCRTLVT